MPSFRTNQRLLASCLVSAIVGTLAQSLTAQHPVDATDQLAPIAWPTESSTPTPIHTAADDRGFAYGVWGGGARYKISFHDGATFVPLLGKDYPHNQPLHWRTVSARRGATELVTRTPQLSYDGARAQYDLGGVVETYDLLPDGVEQTFVVAAAHGNGDLVIRGRITSAMTATDAAAAHQPLQFVDRDGNHLVTYGAATAIDADGRRRTMTTAHADGEITLRLAGDWLDEARFPIVVDPIITSPHQIYTWSELVDSCDVVRASEGNLEPGWVAYATHASATDRDVYLRRVNDDMSVGSEVYHDITSAWSSQGPKVAYVAGPARTVMLFDRWFLDGSRQMRAHDHQAGDLLANSDVTQIDTGHHAWRGDVGGVITIGFDTLALAVWQSEPDTGPFQASTSSGIYATYLNLATGGHTAVFPIADDAQQDHERPSVNQYATGTQNDHWCVAYQTVDVGVLGGDDWDVAVRAVDRSYHVSTPLIVDAGSTDHQFAPTIEGLAGDYAVAYLATPTNAAFPTSDAGHEIRVTRISWPGFAVNIGLEPFGTRVLQGNSDARLEIGGLGFDRDSHSHWALMFRSNVTDNLYLRTVGYRGAQLRAETVFASSGSGSARGGVSYNHATGRYLLAQGRATAWDYVIVDQYEYPSVTPWSAAGIACGPATISWSGKQLIGCDSSAVVVVGTPADAIHLMVLATAPASAQLFGVPPIVDGCWLLVPNTGPDFLALLGFRVGANVSWRIPLPEYLTDDDLYFQGFHTLGSTLELYSTERLRVPIVK